MSKYNIMDIFTTANKKLVLSITKEDKTMCQAVDELFSDRIKEKDIIIANQNSIISDKDSIIANQNSVISDLQAQLEQLRNLLNSQGISEPVNNAPAT